jgi:cohesin loading factor subunit SCC2
VEFVRYMAENVSAFEYKTQEEVLTVIKHLTGVLSTTGLQLVEAISPSNLLTQLHGDAMQINPVCVPFSTRRRNIDVMKGAWGISRYFWSF